MTGSAAPDSGRLAPRDRAALTVTVVGTIAYVALDVLAQALPPHYSPISQAESDLAVGPYGYVMTINFVLRGLMGLAFLLGLAGTTRLVREARVGAALVAVWGVGALLLAAFPTDVGPPVTVHGAIHVVVGLLAFAGGSIGELLLSLHFTDEPRLRSWARGATAVSVLAIVMLFVYFIGDKISRVAPFSGLLERGFIGLVLLWMLVTAIQLLRSARVSGSPAAAG